jgi:hypothetical protein
MKNAATIIYDTSGNEKGVKTNPIFVDGYSITPTATTVAASATSVTLVAENTNRVGVTITNDSVAVLYLKLGVTASTTSYTVQLQRYDYYEVPYGYRGRIDGIWSAATGNARITELS